MVRRDPLSMIPSNGFRTPMPLLPADINAARAAPFMPGPAASPPRKVNPEAMRPFHGQAPVHMGAGARVSAPSASSATQRQPLARRLMNPLTLMGLSLLGSTADRMAPPGRAPLNAGGQMISALDMAANEASAQQMNAQAQPLLQMNQAQQKYQNQIIQQLMQSGNPQVQLSVLDLITRQRNTPGSTGR